MPPPSRPNKRLGRSVTKRWQTGKRHSIIKTGLVQLIIEARFGCKGKSKFWFGYKGHVSVDMGSMLIDRIAATPANISDQAGFAQVCPRSGERVFADKAYCLKPAQTAMKKRGAHSVAILRNNMKSKNKDLDKWRSKMRSPFECIFSTVLARVPARRRTGSNGVACSLLILENEGF